MKEFMIFALFVACISAFCVILLHKWGVVEYMQVNGCDFVYKLFSCDFCLSFWISLLISLFLTCFNSELSLMALPFVSAPLSRFILR